MFWKNKTIETPVDDSSQEEEIIPIKELLNRYESKIKEGKEKLLLRESKEQDNWFIGCYKITKDAIINGMDEAYIDIDMMNRVGLWVNSYMSEKTIKRLEDIGIYVYKINTIKEVKRNDKNYYEKIKSFYYQIKW